MDNETPNDSEFEQINQLYDECLNYLKTIKSDSFTSENETKSDNNSDPGYETIAEVRERMDNEHTKATYDLPKSKSLDPVLNIGFKVEDETFTTGSVRSIHNAIKSERLRRLSQQLPKIIITQSNTSLSTKNEEKKKLLQNHITDGIKAETIIKNHPNVYPKTLKKCASIKR